jgi:hypothetical protein
VCIEKSALDVLEMCQTILHRSLGLLARCHES